MHTWNCENAFVRLAVTVVIYFFTIFSLPVPLYPVVTEYNTSV
jgi:hypothetical protein